MIGRRGFLRAIGAGVLGLSLALKTPDDGPLARFFSDGLRWPDAMRRGDLVTIEGVYAVNPATQTPTAHLQRFVVVEDVIGGTFIEDGSMWPPMYDTGMYQNVSALPSPSARVHIRGPYE